MAHQSWFSADSLRLHRIGTGDTFFHDQMGVRAEGNLISNSITSPIGQYSYVDENGASAGPTNFDVIVTDGEINFEFSDNGGSDVNWVVNRLVMQRVGDADATIQDRFVFYNSSEFDGGSANANASDDQAIAPDKTALLPGQTATIANFTNYSKGINGIMLDVNNLGDSTALSTADFEFATGNGSNAADFTTMTLAVNVSVREGAGEAGSDRVTLTFPDGTANGQWLRVTLKANANIGLPSEDTFYFGNLVGEVSGDGAVTSLDVLGVRSNRSSPFELPSVTSLHDINRDNSVDSIDVLLVRSNRTNPFNELKLITAPSGASNLSFIQSSFATGSDYDGVRRISGGLIRTAIQDQPSTALRDAPNQQSSTMDAARVLAQNTTQPNVATSVQTQRLVPTIDQNNLVKPLPRDDFFSQPSMTTATELPRLAELQNTNLTPLKQTTLARYSASTNHKSEPLDNVPNGVDSIDDAFSSLTAETLFTPMT